MVPDCYGFTCVPYSGQSLHRSREQSVEIRYVDNTWVNIETQELENFLKQINAVDIAIRFTREEVTDSEPYTFGQKRTEEQKEHKHNNIHINIYTYVYIFICIYTDLEADWFKRG